MTHALGERADLFGRAVLLRRSLDARDDLARTDTDGFFVSVLCRAGWDTKAFGGQQPAWSALPPCPLHHDHVLSRGFGTQPNGGC